MAVPGRGRDRSAGNTHADHQRPRRRGRSQLFDGPIRIAVDRALFDRFDFQNFYPLPAKETADPQWVRYEFDPPPGAALQWSFDVRTGPNQVGSFGHYRVRVVDAAGRVLAEIRHSILVVP